MTTRTLRQRRHRSHMDEGGGHDGSPAVPRTGSIGGPRLREQSGLLRHARGPVAVHWPRTRPTGWLPGKGVPGGRRGDRRQPTVPTSPSMSMGAWRPGRRRRTTAGMSVKPSRLRLPTLPWRRRGWPPMPIVGRLRVRISRGDREGTSGRRPPGRGRALAQLALLAWDSQPTESLHCADAALRISAAGPPHGCYPPAPSPRMRVRRAEDRSAFEREMRKHARNWSGSHERDPSSSTSSTSGSPRPGGLVVPLARPAEARSRGAPRTPSPTVPHPPAQSGLLPGTAGRGDLPGRRRQRGRPDGVDLLPEVRQLNSDGWLGTWPTSVRRWVSYLDRPPRSETSSKPSTAWPCDDRESDPPPLRRGRIRRNHRPTDCSYLEVHAGQGDFYGEDRYRRQLSAHRQWAGWALVTAWLNEELIGYVYGFPLAPDTRWWDGIEEPVPVGFIEEDGTRTFAISELLVRAAWRRQGVARALHDELVGSRHQERMTLLARPDNGPAQAAYRSWGWQPSPAFDPAGPGTPVRRAHPRSGHQEVT